MKIVFRTDSSIQIGTGHVLRCLTLANRLRHHGAECIFISRLHTGHLIDAIRAQGFSVHALALQENDLQQACGVGSGYAPWLGCDWSLDAEQTSQILDIIKPEGLVIDHYAIGENWLNAVRPFARRVMVIDDLGNRPLTCDMLLDQNLGCSPTVYRALLPSDCQMLLGPQYALLRPEFDALRSASLLRRKVRRGLKRLLISLGGIDLHNATRNVLQGLKYCRLPNECEIIVVLGKNSPWIDDIKDVSLTMPWRTEVIVNTPHMADLMLNSDFSVGAGGSTSWERCCMGLPSVVCILADNQIQIASALEAAGVAIPLFLKDSITPSDSMIKIFNKLATDYSLLHKMSQAAFAITDGKGTDRVASIFIEACTS